MSGDNIHLLAGAYALNALPLDERAFYERHLAVCEACRLEVAEYAETAATLGVAASEEPPAQLRERVLTDVDTTRQLSPLQTEDPGFMERFRPALTAVAGVLLVAVVGLGGFTAYLLGENAELERQVAATAEGADALPAFLAQAQIVPLASPAGTAAGFVHSDAHNRGMLVVDGLTELDPDHDYQLWLFHDGVPVPAGVFDVIDGVVMFDAEAPVRQAELIAVTVEPSGGLPEPSGEVVLSAEL
jgi:anti-sigma-K factor RskA